MNLTSLAGRRAVGASLAAAAILFNAAAARAADAVPTAGPAFSTSFEAGDPQPTWTSTPDSDAQGHEKASGVSGSSVLERSPSQPTGDDVLGAPTGGLAWEGPFQNGVGSVPGTIVPATTPGGDSAEHWTMESHGETWIQVPMRNLARGATYRAQVTLQGTGELFLNAYSGSSDVGGENVTLTDAPRPLTVDFTTPASGGGTPQFQVRTHVTETIDALVSGTSVRRLTPGSVDFPGDITRTVTEVEASRENPPNETADRLADGDVNTKWLAGASTAWVQYKLAAPTVVVSYALGSANDAPGRDPKNWQLQGSSDGASWTTLDTRSNQSFASRFQTRQYSVDNGTAYLYYRLNITANAGDSGTQLAELLLSTAPIPPSKMTTAVGAGPSDGYNIRPNVGWTGVAALHYAGTQTSTGRGYSYNKVLDVNTPVTASTELSYKIFPEPTGDGLANPSTYAAVDLAFTDGTYLSELGAVDQHSMPLSPQGQGTSKILYPNQWNSETSRIGAVAAGKTIDRVLVAYDNANGPADFGGWVDDISIAARPAQDASGRPSDHVVTTRGTNSSGSFSRGNNFPATALPHGFNFWTPVTDAGSDSWLYEYQKRNNEQNLPMLQAFSLSHEPSPWMGDRQTFQVVPSAATGVPAAGRGARALAFRHDDEVARAHYYGVTFANGMKTEITPTDHAAMFRFTFTGDRSNLVFDNINNEGGLTLDPAHDAISGYTDVSSGGNSAGMTRMFIYASFDAPVIDSGRLSGGGGSNVTGYVKFDTAAAKTVTMRIATSLIGVEQAKHNLALEIAPDDTFDSIAKRAQQAWDKALGVIEVEGAGEDQLTTLYSNLYRLNLYPNSAYENTDSADKPVYMHAVQSSTSSSPAPAGTTATQTGARVVGGKVYVNNGFWDTYRTTWPAYSLLYPQQAGQMVNGFVQQFRDGGWVSRWSSPGYANIMTGTSSDVAFADAYLKGVPGIDVNDMYDAALENATVAPPNQNVGRKGLNSSIFLGYTPTSTSESASWSLEGYINDYGIANLSKKLYDTSGAHDPRRQEYRDNYEYFINRAQDYVKLFNPAVNFFQGRSASGDWAGGFDPRVWGNEFTESDAWNFAFHAPQDGQGLANLFGGRTGLGAKLDAFFSTPETATFPGSYGGPIHEMLEARDVRLGQWGLSNQLSHHIPYMYDYTGRPSKGAAVIREALSRTFAGSDIGQGYPGDEDNGELSAWQIFSSLGFYPLQMGSPTWAIGSPLYTKATIHLSGGSDLVINARHNSPQNVYVQGVKVNGRSQSATYFTQRQLANGGTIDFDMGPKPSAWGTGSDDAPPSLQHGQQVPTPLEDATAPDQGTPTTSEAAVDARALFDNTSDTRATFHSATPWLQYRLTGTTARARMYTLTSSDKAGDPASWVVKGSNNGKTWTTLDTRSGETFKWRLQTRAFTISHPGIYRYYRVEVTRNSGEATTSLAEVELRAHPPKVSELSDAIDAGRRTGGIVPSAARDLQDIVAAAQRAEDANDAAAVVTWLRALRARLDTLPANKVDAAARAALTLVLSQWLPPAAGLDEIREQIGALERSRDIQASTARDLQDIVAAAEQADAGNHSAALGTQLTKLRAAIADARSSKVSQHAKDVLLPLLDALIATPPPVARAKLATDVLMSSYDPGKAWWPSSWWNSAVALQTVEDYMLRTGDRSYLAAVDNTFEKDKGPFPAGVLSGDPLLGNFTSRAIDDSEWWGLTWVAAYDLTGDRKYLDMAVTIARYVNGYWDPGTCGGGVWWDAEKTYKNSVTNGLYVRLTAELHNRIPGDTEWLGRAKTAWDWFTSSGLINSSGLVNDGLDGACHNNGGTVWSYNQGLAIGAGLELWRADHDPNVLTTARRLADAAITSPGLVSGGVLTESCDDTGKTCDDNAKQFKGVFMRYLMDAVDTTHDSRYQAFVDRQATSIWTRDRNARNQLGERWSGADNAAHPNVYDWRTQASALSALIAVVLPRN
jgi:predicted alpha-1,2-mannosidase